MSVDPAYSQSLPCSEASNYKESSPTLVTCGPEENYPSLQMSSTVCPLPSSMDLLIQDSPDSSTSPKGQKPTSAEKSTAKKEDNVPVKRQKTRTVFSSTQLYVLNDRFQRQKYLSLQHMQELSTILNLSYKQVKTWFQNQRMKSKSSGVTQKASAPTYPSLYSSYHQGCLVNTTGNLPMWSNQTCSNSAWSNQTQNVHSWSNHSWCTQAWNSLFYNCGEESLQSCVQFQPNSPASDLEVALETAGESHNVIQQTTRYFSTPQAIDLFLKYSTNMQPEDT
uniref:Homeobox domain-containing protein n=1 Tax=Rhinopithecus roxellana TaxID=61622 RepID=A0A2K6PU35_RHIRO